VTAAVALKAAEVAEVIVKLRSSKLVLQAQSRPSELVVKAVVQHRGGISDLLRQRGVGGNSFNSKGIPTSARPSSDWAEALAALSLAKRPDGFSENQWQRILCDAEQFVGTWAEKATSLGWTILDVFGFHRRAPAARYDAMGLAALIRGGEVVTLTSDRATIRMPTGSDLVFLRTPSSESVPVWELSGARE
jgi:hypothetical protein